MSPEQTTPRATDRATAHAPIRRSPIAVSTYERTAAALVAALILVGLLVSMLFIMWLTQLVSVTQAPVAPELIEPLGGGGSLGDARDLEEPGEEEIEEFDEPELEQTLDAITDVVSSQAATLETLGGDALSSSRGRGGDGRAAGPGSGTGKVVPRGERWEILFATSTLDVYAQQLDAFGIELATVSRGSDMVEYASNFSRPNPTRRTGSAKEENRLRMMWLHGPLRAADKKLLEKAGVAVGGKIQMQFYPERTENALALAEQQYLQQNRRQLEEIKKTTFGVAADGGTYRFNVLSQKTRRLR